MFSKAYVLCLTLFIISLQNSNAQDCSLTIRGTVADEATKLPLSYVSIIIQELIQGTTTDGKGNFLLEGICEGEYHLIISHIGCEAKEIHIHLSADTLLNIALVHTSILLEDVEVRARTHSLDNQPGLFINKQVIEDNANKSLSGLLEHETGVYTLKTGTGIAKPVVHGLYGNRLMILNNGILQSGQQWGNDHSPEIDPLVAGKIIVLKGSSAIEYGGGNLGSIIMIEPQAIGIEPHLHGRINYTYETNGKGNNINLQLQKYSPVVAWRIHGTFKKYGDRKSADYFLNNTGTQEANFAIQLEKSWNTKLYADLYASTFNTHLGVLRGSHIGNLTDLKQALTRDIPFFTEPNFSYAIEAPQQKVGHHLVKLNVVYDRDENQSWQLILAGQLNKRQEFDVRRSGRTDIPALSLEQYTFNAELKYRKNLDRNWKLKIGHQNIFTDNTNHEETGILPLIPDYFSWKSGLFTLLSKNGSKWDFNVGLRSDYELQKIVAISRSLLREIIRYQNHFYNISGVTGFKYDIFKFQSLTMNMGFAMRNPAVNELYSNGLHQGVSGIEEGSINLKIEEALKTTLEYKFLSSNKFSFSSLAYYQRIKNYIFLSPQDEIRLTIRGAFPVFKYEQTDAEIYGVDLSSQFTITHSFAGTLKYSFIKGNDVKNTIPLVNIPPGNLFVNFTYRIDRPLSIFKIKMEDIELEFNDRFVHKQNNLLPEQDFVPPPEAYNLIGFKASTNMIFPQHVLRLFIKIDNLLNTKYRDYLNRQRYFADDMGRSATLGLNFKF